MCLRCVTARHLPDSGNFAPLDIHEKFDNYNIKSASHSAETESGFFISAYARWLTDLILAAN